MSEGTKGLGLDYLHFCKQNTNEFLILKNLEWSLYWLVYYVWVWFLKIHVNSIFNLGFAFRGKMFFLVARITFDHWLVFFNLGFLWWCICSSFGKIIEIRPSFIIEPSFVIYKEGQSNPIFKCCFGQSYLLKKPTNNCRKS